MKFRQPSLLQMLIITGLAVLFIILQPMLANLSMFLLFLIMAAGIPVGLGFFIALVEQKHSRIVTGMWSAVIFYVLLNIIMIVTDLVAKGTVAGTLEIDFTSALGIAGIIFGLLLYGLFGALGGTIADELMKQISKGEQKDTEIKTGS